MDCIFTADTTTLRGVADYSGDLSNPYALADINDRLREVIRALGAAARREERATVRYLENLARMCSTQPTEVGDGFEVLCRNDDFHIRASLDFADSVPYVKIQVGVRDAGPDSPPPAGLMRSLDALDPLKSTRQPVAPARPLTVAGTTAYVPDSTFRILPPYTEAELAARPDWSEQISRCVPRLESGIHIGSAFNLQGVGYVSCAHVFEKDADHLVYGYPHMGKSFEVRNLRVEPDLDLAVFDSDLEVPALEVGSSLGIRHEAEVIVLGWPNYLPGDTIRFERSKVTQMRVRSTYRRILAGPVVFGGMSGGPMLDARGRVIGVLISGNEHVDALEDAVRRREDSAAIQIEAVLDWLGLKRP